MLDKRMKKIFAATLAATMAVTAVPSMQYFADAKTSMIFNSLKNVDKEAEGVYKMTVNDKGVITPDETTPFSWDNANVYFMLTDRFANGDTSNDHAYGRSVDEVDAGNYQSRVGTFHGGDLKGVTEKIEDGYFDELGTNAIWITAPYEQIHGALCGTGYKHYAYHGYYTLDYTEVDDNMGTAKDLEKFIDTAHSHGIRVIFDVVMNHAGYADPVTISEYFGEDSTALSEDWKDIYYNRDENTYKWYNDYAEIAPEYKDKGMLVGSSKDWVNKWWGPDWVRAVTERFSGYTGVEGDGVTTCLSGLPDFKTESTKKVELPALLKAKWEKEGCYKEKLAMTMASMEKAGCEATVSGYLVSWLSQWVRDYGVDGFRCDTAKHIEKQEWGKLSKACSSALNEWRTNHPNKPGAQWTDDFWMTGEDYGRGLKKDDYYTTGGFDSMINFKFCGNETKTGAQLESVYADYASKINEEDNFNVLSYISSHDVGLGARSANAGVALLLCPGGVQTFYGDESGRKLGQGNGDKAYRSQMNWDSMEEGILSVWQKLGQFRRNHIAVGAGEHAQLATAPYTFSRTYTGTATCGANREDMYDDKVVVSLPAKAGNYQVPVAGVFVDGQIVRDEFSGETYVVENNCVSVSCDANGVILLSETNASVEKAVISAKVSDGIVKGHTYSSDTMSLDIKTKNMEDTTYRFNGCDKVAFKDATTVTFGNDTAYGEKTTITVEGVSAVDQSRVTKKYTYTRSEAPVIEYLQSGLYVRVKKSDFDRAPQIYAWTVEAITSAWPGDEMVEDGDYYVYRNDSLEKTASIIIHSYISNSSQAPAWRSVPDMAEPEPVSGCVELEKGATSGTLHSVQIPSGRKEGKLIVEFRTKEDTIVKSIERVGEVGEQYTYKLPKLLTTNNYEICDGQKMEASGFFQAENETLVIYVGQVGEEVIATAIPTAAPTAEPTEEPISNRTTLYYQLAKGCDWKNVYAHYGVNDKWTSVPGELMENLGNGLFKADLKLGIYESASVCFNDGNNHWDSKGGSNYSVRVGEFIVDQATGLVQPYVVEATASPTVPPTVEPTATPTVEPTATPTVEPTATPTVEPTATPTVEPTATPTVAPTATPTATPTVEPTATPTVAPTATTTIEPTATVDPAENIVVVYYKRAENTSWSDAYMHFKAMGVWTNVPGVKMTKLSNGYWMSTIALGNTTEAIVCFNNGKGTWDNNNMKNYSLSVGAYLVDQANKTVRPVDTEPTVAPTAEPTVVPTAEPTPTTEPTPTLTPTATIKPTLVPVEKQVVVYYKASSSWKKAYAHYRISGGAWTKVPGVKMQQTSEKSGYNYKITVPMGRVNKIYMCFNDGKGNWDSRNGANYTLKSGTYGIKSGKVMQLK